MTAPATGGCLCGAVRYELAEAPRKASYCHCTMCRRASGGAFQVYVRVRPGQLRWVRGEPKTYRSSPQAVRDFCAECGAPLLFRYDHHPERIGLTVSSLDHPQDVTPVRHEGVESWLPWLKIDDGLPRGRTEVGPELAALQQQSKKKA